MIQIILCLAFFALPVFAAANDELLPELVALERKVMDGFLKGDPGPQLAIADAQITYVHDQIGNRLEGLPALQKVLDGYRGVPLFDSYEILSPKVQSSGDVAVLSYQLAQNRGGSTKYWNGTHVYVKKQEGWRVIHSHWSAAKERASPTK